jgi:hypothetical protein
VTSPTGYTIKVLVNRDVTIPIPPILYGIGIGGIGIVTSLFTSAFIVYPVGLGSVVNADCDDVSCDLVFSQ